MDILEPTRQKLADPIVPIAQIARETGVSRDTIYRIRDGIGKPIYDNVAAVYGYLSRLESESAA